MELDTTIKMLKVICERNDLREVSADMYLDCAVRIVNTSRINAKSDSDGATEKQKATMVKLNIEFKDDVSKKDASKLIGDKIDSFK